MASLTSWPAGTECLTDTKVQTVLVLCMLINHWNESGLKKIKVTKKKKKDLKDFFTRNM